MTREEFSLHWHRKTFILECIRKTGLEFQHFFERVMEKHDPTFIKVKPSGRAGDWKNDGFSEGTGTVYQVYAPEGLTVADAVDKIAEDFDGAREHWGDAMRGWTFVWSSRGEDGLPPQVLAELVRLRAEHPDLQIGDWGHEPLWAVVAALPEPDRVHLLGAVPFVDVPPAEFVAATTAAEVQTLLNFVVDQEIPHRDDDLTLIDLGDKMDRNGFTEGVRMVIDAGLPIVMVVRHYVDNHPDVRFSQRVSVALADRYETLRARGLDGDGIFVGLTAELANGQGVDSREYWAAVGVIDHYFELCDLFER